MMKILIVSDTHGRLTNLEKILKKTGPIDRMIHLGDVEGDEANIRSLVRVPVDMVAGNNDYFSALPSEMKIELGTHKALLTHGHHYFVSMGHEMLREEAKKRGVDIVMYGHTHRPCLERSRELTILNPGSLSLPRQEGHEPSWIMMYIDDKGEADYNICYLNNMRRIF